MVNVCTTRAADTAPDLWVLLVASVPEELTRQRDVVQRDHALKLTGDPGHSPSLPHTPAMLKAPPRAYDLGRPTVPSQVLASAVAVG
jgi:hypothetical protein